LLRKRTLTELTFPVSRTRLNAERAAKSKATRALDADIRMFGQAAIDEDIE
jgi:hypothetical protein